METEKDQIYPKCTFQVNRENKPLEFDTLLNTQSQLYKWKYLRSIFFIQAKMFISFKSYWSRHSFFKLYHASFHQNPHRPHRIAQADEREWDLEHTHEVVYDHVDRELRTYASQAGIKAIVTHYVSSWTHYISNMSWSNFIHRGNKIQGGGGFKEQALRERKKKKKKSKLCYLLLIQKWMARLLFCSSCGAKEYRPTITRNKFYRSQKFKIVNKICFNITLNKKFKSSAKQIQNIWSLL